MAKKKKKSSTHRRRRISGINKNETLFMLLGVAGGYFLGPKLNDKLTHVADPTIPTDKNGILHSVDPKIIAAGEILLGYFGKKAIPKKFAMVGDIAGGVLMGAGLQEALKAFGVVSGINVISGYRDLRAIAGINAPKRINDVTPSNNMSGIQVLSGVNSYCNPELNPQ